MASKNYTLNFEGFWLNSNVNFIPKKPGIYCVYSCMYFKDRNTIGINELLYIGESDDVGNRISNHESKNKWIEYVFNSQLGQTLCYSFADFAQADEPLRKHVVVALIKCHKPPLPNLEIKESHSISELMTVKTKGCNSNLRDSIEIRPDSF